MTTMSMMEPVTHDDPLGALSQPDSGEFKTPTREKAVSLIKVYISSENIWTFVKVNMFR